MAKRIDGKAIAAQIKQELKEQVQQLAKDNITVTLAVIPVGQDPAETNSEPVRSLESTAFPMNWKKRRRRRNCFP